MVTLPLNQKRLIKALSLEPEKELYGASFSMRLAISGASIRRSVEALLLKDLIFQDEKGFYRVMDPALSFYLRGLH